MGDPEYQICQRCPKSHEQVLVKAGASRETVREAVSIVAIVNSAYVTLEAEDSLA
jgi:alkylhydroperoxidase/carboxymuconolactone decarboxylase family protein YurZ